MNTQIRDLQPGTIAHRKLTFDRASINVEARTVELAFSSETPYERWYGIEILDHARSSVRMERMQQGGAVLVEHDRRDLVGITDDVRLDTDRVGRAVVRFGNSARAQEVFQDVVDGIRRWISVGYIVHAAVLVEQRDGVETYRVTDWEPLEISFVSIPADPTVGVGRSHTPDSTPRIEIKESTVDGNTPSTNPADAERQRSKEILAIAKQYRKYGLDDLAEHAVSTGMSVEDFRGRAMDRMTTAPKESAAIGMTESDHRNYSLTRLLSALSTPNDAALQRSAGFEFELAAAAADKATGEGRKVRGTMIPWDVLTRDLSVGTATAGGNTVATNLLSGSFIQMLRNAMLLPSMGATIFDDIVGNIAIPRQTAGNTAYWVGEGGEVGESDSAFDQVTLSPKTVAGRQLFTRLLLKQSSISVEQFVRNELAVTLGLGVQLAAINGSGSSNQPRGILNTSGIGNVAGGTNGGAPTWAHIVDLETAVSVANASVETMQYLTNAKVKGVLKKTSRVSGQNGFVWDNDNLLNGYTPRVTNAVPSNLTKGTASTVCSAIIFGDFSALLMAMWGGIDVIVNPYTYAKDGKVEITVHQDVDIAVRHAESFSAMKDALTA